MLFGQYFHDNHLKKFWLHNKDLDISVITEATASNKQMKETNLEIKEKQRQEDKNNMK